MLKKLNIDRLAPSKYVSSHLILVRSKKIKSNNLTQPLLNENQSKIKINFPLNN
jgi:hypothetical protein